MQTHSAPTSGGIRSSEVIFDAAGHTLRRILVSGLAEDVDTSVRYSYDSGDRAFVLPYDEESGRVLLARQLRIPVLLRGGSLGTTIEAPGGLIDGSTAEETARREAAEEVGVALGDLRHVCSVHMAPQMSGDLTHLFIGPYDAGMIVGLGGGLPAECERIDVMEMTVLEALAAVASGEVTDAKTVLLLLHLKSSGLA